MTRATRRAVYSALLIALPLSIIGMLLMSNEGTASAGAAVLVAMPFITGMALAYSFRGPEAFCLTAILASIILVATSAIIFGPNGLAVIAYLAAPMCAATLVGITLGIVLRHRFKK